MNSMNFKNKKRNARKNFSKKILENSNVTPLLYVGYKISISNNGVTNF